MRNTHFLLVNNKCDTMPLTQHLGQCACARGVVRYYVRCLLRYYQLITSVACVCNNYGVTSHGVSCLSVGKLYRRAVSSAIWVTESASASARFLWQIWRTARETNFQRRFFSNCETTSLISFNIFSVARFQLSKRDGFSSNLIHIFLKSVKRLSTLSRNWKKNYKFVE